MKTIRNLTLTAILLSVLFHLVAGLGLLITSENFDSTDKEETITMYIMEPDSKTKGQIVDQSEKPLNDEIPEDAKFLSKHNQRVVKETRAANSGEFKNTAGQGKAPQQAQNQTPKKTRSKTDKALTSPHGLPTLQSLKPKFDWNKVGKNKRKTVQRKGDPSQSSDYLKEVEVGNQTLLSTREFVYYSYYARIKRKIQQYWEPKIKHKIRRLFHSGRKIASSGDRLTKLLIILNANGKLVGVQVLGESGIRDLDDAAVEAFQAAAPFPNPPKGMVEPDGTIKIRWDFILEG